ncbi:VPLPA-CTERM sorting domain-containing protein [Puniceibacterium sediminis]|uniref:VPLPA-CTERM protein sorting domain-containing protein n=1 Tax=Puniceibacterium sediminis TaxID=1608407 RepID=A0A238VEL8_9RHOB|nr:VPLPA-CTERM sorting domain-containing protein [Puniceibacterium sediminis]SNR32852.1 VPLPA-CTERM protein sorting domain-containing protein [Puniceibacterium sediminis]
MRMLNIMTAVSAAVLSVSLASTASASTVVTIDTFDVTSTAVDDGGGFLPNAVQVSGASILGGFRDTQAANNTGEFLGTVAKTNGSSSGFLNVSNGAGTSGSGTFTWDGDDSPTSVNTFGLGGVDLSLGVNDSFAFDVISIDAPFLFSLQLWDADSSSTALKTFQVSDAGTTQYILFSEFSGIDFTNVGAIQLILAGGNNSDIEINEFSATIVPPATVPLPASIPLLMVGLGALGLMRRKNS